MKMTEEDSSLKNKTNIEPKPKKKFVGGLLVFLILLVFVSAIWRAKIVLNQSLANLKSSQGRINLLLLGAGGDLSQAKDLTDTIIFLSLNPDKKKIVMIPLPRDIWITSMRAKLNTAYHYGNENNPEDGLTTAESVVEEMIGQPIHYGVLVDFNGLVGFIDALGGVDINVERGFDDFKYPLPGKENDECDGDPEYKCRYEHLHFDAGLQRMDGEKALKYVRSRNAEGEEGTDFARSRRQERLLMAIRKKLFSSEMLFHPRQLVQLIKLGGQAVKTDVYLPNYPAFIFLAWCLKEAQVYTSSLEPYLINPPKGKTYDSQWVLIPRKDWKEIQEYITSLFKEH